MDDGDLELERRVRDDPAAFARLYELNFKRIFNYILYTTGDIETSLDLTSETFFKALRALPGYKYSGASFSSWLYRIASHEISSYYRKVNRSRTLPMSYFSNPEDIERLRLTINDEELNQTRNELECSEDFIALSQSFRKIPRKYREVLFLRFYQDHSFEEIARILNRPLSTVKSQNRRGLKLLRRTMQLSEAAGRSKLRGLETVEIEED